MQDCSIISSSGEGVMTGSIGSKCAELGCYAMVVAPQRYCSTHKKQSAYKKVTKERLPLYNTAAWKNARLAFLSTHPLCNRCGAPASIVHHIKSARDHPELRLDPDNFESLCFACHQTETGEEIAGRRYALGLPPGRRFVCKATAIVGPPGAGKTTLALKSAGSNDIIVDLDRLNEALTVSTGHAINRSLLGILLDIRREVIDRLMTAPCPVQRAWLIFTAPLASQREELTEAGAEVLLLNPGRDVCYCRVENDTTRGDIGRQLELVDAWYEQFTEGHK
jgi:5-methylcytosine-specific restriction enzyme A